MTLQAMRAQLDKCCRRNYVKPKTPLSGIEKHQAELDENTRMWSELREEKR